jgi:dihydropteroate synthase
MLPPRRIYPVTDQDWRTEIERVGADPVTWDRLRRKCRVLAYRTDPLSLPAATIIKQCMLSGGGDAIVARGVITCRCSETEALILGTEKQIRAACASMEGQPFDVAELGSLLLASLDQPVLPDSLELGDARLEYGQLPLVMGILNVTPDSFSDGGSFLDPGEAVDHALAMVDEGASIVDVGGESTRPGSLPVSADEQAARILPVIRAIRARSDVPVSVDTTSPEVAAAALSEGASMVNDVSALAGPGMAEAIAGSGVPVVLMHMQGVPETMQDSPGYGSVFDEVLGFLEERAAFAVEKGIPREKVLVDPGIGFGKELHHNIVLLSRLGELRRTGCRVVLGHSRKSFLGLLTGEDSAGERDPWTHVVSVLVCRSADILRVHDVGGTVRSLRIAASLGGGT